MGRPEALHAVLPLAASCTSGMTFPVTSNCAGGVRNERVSLLPAGTVHDAARTQTPTQEAPLVTVIVTTFAQEQYIEECLRSVAAVRHRPLHIIVTDDASPESEERVVKKWFQENQRSGIQFEYMKNAKNLGLPATLNRAIALARGEYICLIAADDLLDPDSIKDRLHFLGQHPWALAVFADSRVIDGEGVVVADSAIENWLGAKGVKQMYGVQALLSRALVFRWAVAGPTFMCRRTLFGVVGDYDENIGVEDWDMYLRIAEAKRLGFLDRVVASYRVHASSASATRRYGPSETAKVARKHFRSSPWSVRLRFLAYMMRRNSRSANSNWLLRLSGIPFLLVFVVSDWVFRLEVHLLGRGE